MGRRLAQAIAGLGVVAAGTAAVAAHHSAAMFDEKKTVTLEGEVKQFQLTNPHSWLLVDVKEKDGKTTTWGFEAEGPSTLARAFCAGASDPRARATTTSRPCSLTYPRIARR